MEAVLNKGMLSKVFFELRSSSTMAGHVGASLNTCATTNISSQSFFRLFRGLLDNYQEACKHLRRQRAFVRRKGTGEVTADGELQPSLWYTQAQAVTTLLKVLCQQDMHLNCTPPQLSFLHDKVTSMPSAMDADNITLGSYGSSLQDGNRHIVSLLRTCRKVIREHISTAHGRRLIPFDLRVSCWALPLPPLLKHYLKVSINNN